MLVALLGAWGALTENKILLYVYFGLLVFFAVVEFAVGISAYVKKDEVGRRAPPRAALTPAQLPDFASAAWTVLYNTDRTSIQVLENSFQCCGWNNYR